MIIPFPDYIVQFLLDIIMYSVCFLNAHEYRRFSKYKMQIFYNIPNDVTL